MLIEDYVKLVEDTLDAQEAYFRCPKTQPMVKSNLLQKSKEMEARLRKANNDFRTANAKKLQNTLF